MTVTIKATAFWACVQKKNELSDKYQVDLSLDEATVAALKADAAAFAESKGLNPALADPIFKNKGDDRGTFITVKSGDKPVVVDSQGKPFPDGMFVGNGSIIKMKARPYNWTFKGKPGLSIAMGTLMVTALSEYSDAPEVEEGGFTLDKNDVIFADDADDTTFDDLPFEDA